MDDIEIVAELDNFALYPRSFSYNELSDLVDPEIDRASLRAALAADKRFIKLADAIHEQELFVSTETLYVWFANLSIRLAEAKVSRIDETRLAALMSSLRLAGQWNACPTEGIQFACRYGFVEPAWTVGQYVLPIAHILSFTWPSLAKRGLKELSDMGGAYQNSSLLEEAFQSSVSAGLSNFSPRTVTTVLAREVLETNKKITLAEIGRREGVTRERVRQIEAKFWVRLNDPEGKMSLKRREHYKLPFIVSILCDVTAKQGSLFIDKSSPNASLRRFAAKCAGVPLAEVPICGLAIVGASPEQIAVLNQFVWGRNRIDAREMAVDLENGQICLAKTDLMNLCDRLAAIPPTRLNKVQRVRIVLEMIGKPAHYSEVTEIYNDLFPDDVSSEHSIHVVLLRGEPDIVWIGTKGTYALHEWGYDRPTATIFETVAKIVKLKSTETGRPVPMSVIAAEIGKYRRVVHPTSIYLATYLNPALESIHGDSFIPRNIDGGYKEGPDNEVAAILEQFAEQTGRRNNQVDRE